LEVPRDPKGLGDCHPLVDLNLISAKGSWLLS